MSRRSEGMTLIELVLAIAVLSVGVAGVLSAFSTTTAASADPLVRKQMLSIAEQMMEEVTLQPFTPVGTAPGNTPGPCGSREAFDDVLDYDGLQTTSGFCASDGTALPRLAGYDVGVSVNAAASVNPMSGTGNLGGGNVYQITVTVTHGAENLRLVGWRSGYATGLPD